MREWNDLYDDMYDADLITAVEARPPLWEIRLHITDKTDAIKNAC